MSHGLDRIQWNDEGETMSHPPETSLSSRELAERLQTSDSLDMDAALIDAWVRVREAKTYLNLMHEVIGTWDECMTVTSFGEFLNRRESQLNSALATARKQLEKKI